MYNNIVVNRKFKFSDNRATNCIKNKIPGTTASKNRDGLKRLLPNDVQGTLWLVKR